MGVRQARGLTLDRRTQVMGAVAIAGLLGAGTVELARVWRRGSAPLPTEADDLLEAAGTATLETIAVVREGYRATSNRENAVFNLLVSFTRDVRDHARLDRADPQGQGLRRLPQPHDRRPPRAPLRARASC